MKSLGKVIKESLIKESMNDNIFWKLIADIQKANGGSAYFASEEDARKALQKVFHNDVKKAVEFGEAFYEKADKILDKCEIEGSDDECQYVSWDVVISCKDKKEYMAILKDKYASGDSEYIGKPR